MILNFAPDEHRDKIRADLVTTKLSYERIHDVLQYIQNNCVIKPTYESLTSIITRQLFPQYEAHIDFFEENIETMKLNLLSIMIVKMSLFRLGYLELDDRDSWSHKRLDTAGKSFESLFTREYMKTIRTVMKKDFPVNANATIISQRFQSSELTSRLADAFIPGRWSTKAAYNTMTNNLVRFNAGAVVSHLTRVSIPSTNKGKNTKSRDVSQSQAGFICPAESPEGKNCGLNLNLGITAYVTHDTDMSTIYNRIIEEFDISEKKEEDLDSPLILNGMFIGWCNGEDLKDYLIDIKRMEYQFLCVVYEENILYVYSDSSRPMRPLLVVNPKTHRLFIDEMNAWNKPFGELISDGFIEYVDPWEQIYLHVAMSKNTLNDIVNDYEIIKRRYEDSCLIEKQNLTEQEILRVKSSLEKSGGLMEDKTTLLKMLKEAEKYVSFSHCEMLPYAIFGIVASTVPYASTNQAVRNAYSCNMSKQTLSVYNGMRGYYFGEIQKTLALPQRPIVETDTGKMIGSDTMPSGQNLIVSFSTYFGKGQEDSVIVKKEAIERGALVMTVFHVYKCASEKQIKFNEYFPLWIS